MRTMSCDLTSMQGSSQPNEIDISEHAKSLRRFELDRRRQSSNQLTPKREMSVQLDKRYTLSSFKRRVANASGKDKKMRNSSNGSMKARKNDRSSVSSHKQMSKHGSSSSFSSISNRSKSIKKSRIGSTKSSNFPSKPQPKQARKSAFARGNEEELED